MKKRIIFGIIIVVIFLTVMVVVKINDQRSEAKIDGIDNTTDINQVVPKEDSQVDKVQVFLFHATMRCPTCIAIGRLAGETVNERFKEELKSGRIEFKEINIDLPENKELAQKFQVVGSALYINTIKDGADNIEQDIRVWSLVNDGLQFKDYLEGRVNNLFGK